MGQTQSKINIAALVLHRYLWWHTERGDISSVATYRGWRLIEIMYTVQEHFSSQSSIDAK
jgi:hypothetical protein